MNTTALFVLSAGLVAATLAAADFPQAEISNGEIRAKLYLPDPENGYYRGTRFDWSGVMPHLEFRGHNYFGQWFERYDPKLHDAIMGPVEDFRTNGAGLGYDEAQPGGKFIKIGIGVLRKPKEKRYNQATQYELLNSGKWSVRKGPDWIEFVHELTDDSGYAYLYTKTVRLAAGKPEMILDHTLRNTGRRPIQTEVYNHNFFVIDSQPTGPDFTVQFPFDLISTRDLRGIAEVRGNRIVYLKELAAGQSLYTTFTGFGKTAKDYDIRIENRKVGAGVRITGDRPLSQMVFWCVRSTLCPEPYIPMNIAPGSEFTWRIAYEFYTLPAASSK